MEWIKDKDGKRSWAIDTKSLKYLLYILDNLVCVYCDEKFEEIRQSIKIELEDRK